VTDKVKTRPRPVHFQLYQKASVIACSSTSLLSTRDKSQVTCKRCKNSTSFKANIACT